MASPEDEIIIIENFVSNEVADTLIRYFVSHKPQLNNYTDNQVSLGEIASPPIRKLFFSLVHQVIGLIQEKYSIGGKKIWLDHGALFGRIPPNFAPYHSDNTYFYCPTHGTNQTVLRRVCNQMCPGSQFVPNHTGWREYTALLYLNDDFTGGEIAFEDGPCNKLYKKFIPIRKALLVLSPNGPNFYHEVLPMRQGTRYSMHLWFTSDPRHFFPFYQ